ncbi:relaxase MobL, partial [Flavonifractor plautii]
IFQQDLLHVYEQKTEYRDALGRDAERTMAELITQMETGQLQNENLERLVLELAQRLHNTQGKKVYGYLPPKTKALVDAIVDELAKDERVAAAYNLWNQMREEVCRTYSEQLPERLPLSKQKEFKAVRNMVIRE